VLENRLSHALFKGVSVLVHLIDLNEIRYKNNIQLLCNFYFDENRCSVNHILLKGVKTFYQYFITERIDKGTEAKPSVLCKVNAVFTQNL
jgi:hypothetical protein